MMSGVVLLLPANMPVHALYLSCSQAKLSADQQGALHGHSAGHRPFVHHPGALGGDFLTSLAGPPRMQGNE
jgi:hypothetical protein